jgi:hypothetical protein
MIAAATSRGQPALTAEYKLHLLSPAMGERLICRARVIKPGRQVAVVAADVFCVTDGIEKHTATALASIAMLEKAPRGETKSRRAGLIWFHAAIGRWRYFSEAASSSCGSSSRRASGSKNSPAAASASAAAS